MDRACLITVAVLAAYFFVRIARSPSAWLAQFDFYALLGALLLYFVTALFITGNGARIAVICGLLVLAVGQVAIGIYQFAKDANFNPLVSESRAEAGFRASGLFISPNHLAGFLEAVLILSTSLFFWSGFRARAKMLFGYLALICLAGLVLTGSRGGYLSAGAGLAVFAAASVWALRSRLSHGAMPRIVAIVGAIAVIGATLAFVAERSYAIRTRANTVFVASDIRLHLWQAAWKQFQLAPVFGTGSRTYVYYGRMFRDRAVQTDPVFAHNDWLQTLAEYGIVGVILIVGMVLAHLRHGWRRWTELTASLTAALPEPGQKNALAIQIGTIGAIAAALMHAMIDFNLHIPANLLLVAFLFGMLATRDADTRWEKTRWPARILHAIPVALGLWMLIVGAPRVPGELFAEIARGKIATGRIRSALEDAGEAIGRGVRNPDLYFQLGEVQRLTSQNLPSDEARRFAIEDARESYAEALAIFPQDVGIVLRNAWALDRLGRFDEADPLIARAKLLDPNSPIVWVYGALHWKMRDKPAEALADYHTAFALGPWWITKVLGDLQETFDPADMEARLRDARPAEQK
jgi:O-antigen ligase